MKKWNTPEVCELNINETANGGNNYPNEQQYAADNLGNPNYNPSGLTNQVS